MISQKTIKLYVYVDGINDVPFYGDVSSAYEEFILANGELFQTANGFIFNVRHTNEQIEIGSFRYDAKRMGGAPTISFTLMYEDCLDNFWGENVYAVFNGEKYFLKQTPTSSLSNEDARYKHEVELISERVALDNVYFFDAVVGVPQESDKPVSNSSKVVFFGDIHEFAHRMNASLEYSGLDYEVVVDDEITTEEKLMSFEDQFFSNVLQEIYNTYKVPYYFVGKTIHIGFANDAVVPPTFAYGVDDALLSITKNNANFKIVNRATGYGSSDNIPFYYPNNAPKGQLDVTIETTSDDLSVRIKDYEKFSDEMKIGDVFSFVSNNVNITNGTSESSVEFTTAGTPQTNSYRFESLVLKDEFVIDCRFPCRRVLKFIPTNSLEYTAYGENHMNNSIMETIRQPITYAFHYGVARLTNIGTKQIDIKKIGELEFEVDLSKGTNTLSLALEFKAGYHNFLPIGDVHELNIEGECLWEMTVEGEDSAWRFGDDTINLEDYGLVATGTPSDGDTIAQTLVKYVNTSKNLMPSIYRQSDGKERFYNAVNYPFPFVEGYELKYGEYVVEDEGNVHNDAYKNEDGTYIHFDYPYVEGKAKEHIVAVEDLMPTIKEAVNSMGLRMDMFSEFAYDDDDNDETIENEEGSQRDYVHSYFFGKLRKLDFNLFEHAIENQPMTISFTSGDCGACNFEIGVTEEFPQKNPVLVNADGTLKRDEDGNVICGQFQEVTEDEIQDIQQDTINNEVWIALKKEDSTYGILMPKAPTKEVDENGDEYEVGGHRPKACTEGQNDGDTFVILGINLPESYIINAEKKLEAEIIKYLQENNDEKFTFSINFSRIYFEENPDVLNYLNENSRINITYNGKTYLLYVTSFSYSMGEGDVLPEIRVELDEGLVVSQNALQNAINQVKSEVGRALSNIDTLALAQPYFIRKDTDDEANGKINFTKGIKFGEGGKVDVLDNNSAKLTIEYLEVTKKASFTSLEVKEKTHVGGQIIISPAAMTCGEVEELDDVYRCYFQTKGADGNDEIFNQFVVNDLAICQTYNAWGSRYYWRKVVGVGEDYIDLSKTICDEESGIPMAGDKIVQLGNTEDAARQAAQVLSAYGDDAPSFIMYNGINDFTLEGKNITGVIWNPNTQEPQMYSYGSFFFGDGTTDENGNLIGEDFITFQKRDGDTKKKLHINATVNFSSDSTGLSNLEEWKGVQTEISGINKTIEQVQDQIDGVVENWNGEGTPTLTNEPAVNWLTDAEKIAHINDTYINIEEYVDDETTPTAGQAWRWCKCTNESITDYVEATDKDGVTYKLHWHPIADSDAVRALREVAKKADKSDLEVLTKNLKDGSTIVDGGLVMTSLVAVRNNEEKIEAFLNGSGEFKDDTHGKLILASGIPEGTTNIKDRAKEANTRLYDDGHFETIKGKIAAFEIKGQELIASSISSTTKITPYRIELLNEETNLGDHIILTRESSPSEIIPSLKINKKKIFSKSDYVDEVVAAEIKCNSEVGAQNSREATALVLASPNNAIKAENGMFAGLRPKTRTVTSTSQGSLTALDHTIMVVSTSALTLTLPDNPEVGQEYDIYFAHQTEVNFPLKSNDISIHWTVADIWGVKQTNITGKGVVKIICAKDQNGSKLWWVYRLA